MLAQMFYFKLFPDFQKQFENKILSSRLKCIRAANKLKENQEQKKTNINQQQQNFGHSKKFRAACT
jgi:hypothetical protein